MSSRRIEALHGPRNYVAGKRRLRRLFGLGGAMLAILLGGGIYAALQPSEAHAATNEPLYTPNTGTPAFSIGFVSRPTDGVIVGTCAKFVVRVTTNRIVALPRVEVGGWYKIQPCKGTTSLRQDTTHYQNKDTDYPIGNPYWVFPERMVKNGVVAAGTSAEFTIYALVPFNTGQFYIVFTPLESGHWDEALMLGLRLPYEYPPWLGSYNTGK